MVDSPSAVALMLIFCITAARYHKLGIIRFFTILIVIILFFLKFQFCNHNTTRKISNNNTRVQFCFCQAMSHTCSVASDTYSTVLYLKTVSCIIIKKIQYVPVLYFNCISKICFISFCCTSEKIYTRKPKNNTRNIYI